MNNENPNSIAIQVISTYQEVSFMGTLSANYQKSVINRKSSCCCCSCGKGLKGNLIYLIVMTVITIALGLVGKFTSLTSMQEYKLLKELVYDNIKNEDKNYFNFDRFWFEYEDFEFNITIAVIICTIILLIFVIIELVLYISTIKNDTNFSFLRKIFVLINFCFYICFSLLFMFLIYVIAYAIFVLFMNPGYFDVEEDTEYYSDAQKDYARKKFLRGVIHNIIILLLTIFTYLLTSVDKTIFFYLEIYNEDDDNNNENNNNNINNNIVNTNNNIIIQNPVINQIRDKIKRKEITLGNQTVTTQIKLNKSIFIKDIQPEKETIEFRPILLESLRTDFIYIKLSNKGIYNMLTFTNWRYPNMDPMVNNLKSLAWTIFISIIMTYLPTLFHIKDIPYYQELNDILKQSGNIKAKLGFLFKILGSLENIFTTTRFYVYTIILIALALFILKRLYFGGFSRLSYLSFCRCLSIFLYTINLIYIIVSLLFAIICIISIYTIIDFESHYGASTENNHYMLIFIVILQSTLSASFFGEMIRPSLSKTKIIKNDVKKYKDDLEKLYDNNNTQGTGISNYQFTGLDNVIHSFNEVLIPGFPRYLLYELSNDYNYIYAQTNNNNAVNIYNNTNNRINEDEKLEK